MAKCPNECGTEMVADGKGGLYCDKCDITVRIDKGKIVADLGKGKIQELEDQVGEIRNAFNSLVADLKGEDGLDEFGI